MVPARTTALLAALAWVACALGVACSKSPPVGPSNAGLPRGTARVETPGGVVELRVRMAETEQARARGLMGVRSLDADEGMAFVFPGPTTAAFWMKDTAIPLSIVFWGPGGRILSVQEMAPCAADPCPLYSPGRPFTGAAEANRGFFSGHGVGPGDRVRLVRTG